MLLVLILTTSAANAPAHSTRNEREASRPFEEAINAARVDPRLDIELLDVQVQAPRCRPERVDVPPVASSGRIAVRVSSARCRTWAWVTLRVTGPAWRVTRAVARGERLASAATPVRIERTRGQEPLLELPDDARAARAIAPGTILHQRDLRPFRVPGDSVRVIATAGALTVEQRGRLVPCQSDRACALLPNGRRVEGVLEGDQLRVENL